MSQLISVTVRSPQGASLTLKVNVEEKVGTVDKKAVDDFVKEKLMQPGDYALVLVRGAQSTEMADDQPLEKYGVVNGDVLHLVPRKPQVDG